LILIYLFVDWPWNVSPSVVGRAPCGAPAVRENQLFSEEGKAMSNSLLLCSKLANALLCPGQHDRANPFAMDEPPPPAPRRPTFSSEYKLRILAEADGSSEPGAIGALLRREGLYTSHPTEWRRQGAAGELQAGVMSLRSSASHRSLYVTLNA
jgi:hypothetical protein